MKHNLKNNPFMDGSFLKQLPLINNLHYQQSSILKLLLVGCFIMLVAACVHAPQIRDRRVSVLEFESAQPNPKSQEIAQWLAAELAHFPRVAVVEAAILQPYLKNQPKTGNYLQEAGRKAGVDYLIVGSLTQADRNYIVNARLLAVSNGEVVKGSPITRACNREEDLYPVTQAIARVMAEHLKFLAESYDAQARAQGR